MRRLSYCLLMALFGLFTSLNAQTEWTGAVNTDWFNAGNWDNGLPDIGNDATIPLGNFVHIDLSSNTDFEFQINNNGLIEILLNGSKLRMKEDILNSSTGIITIVGSENGAFVNRGNITNNGSMVLTECAQFWARNNSSVSGSGTFENFGILYELGSGFVNITGGTGVVFDDLNLTPTPTANCIPTLTISLDSNGESTISDSDVDNISSAPYCYITNYILSKTDFDCSDIGNIVVSMEVVDALGNSAICQTALTVEDTIAPIISCPISIVKDLNPGACEEIVEFDFSISASDNCGSPNISQTDASGLSSGDAFPIGTTWLTFEAFDGYNTSDCIFSIVINEFIPITNGLSCHNQINVSLGLDCYEVITPAHILSGDYGCYDDFEVVINELGTDWVDASHIGELLTVSVTSLESGNHCWGKALIEEKSPPKIEDCGPVTISCLQDPRPTIEGGDAPTPDFSDCSGVDYYYYVDAMITGDCKTTYQMYLTRLWTFADVLGNISTCEQDITIERATLQNETPTCPTNFSIQCQIDSTINLDPEYTGYPTLPFNGTDIYIGINPASACGLTASFVDDTIPKCGAAFRIVRNWLVADWCLPMDGNTNPWSCSQIIDFQDIAAPIVTLPNNLVLTPDGNCRAMGILPPAQIEDCSDVSVIIITPVGPIQGNGGPIPAPGLTIGTHEIIYKSSDLCGNSSIDTLLVTVEDDLDPYMICIQHTVIGLTNDGTAYSFPQSFDNGSYDNCGPIELKVRRMDDGCFADTTFQDYVRFCCDDVGSTVMIVLQGTDWFGHSSECMVEVNVQDKIDPYLQCPPDITLDCGDDYTDLSLTGDVVTSLASQTSIDGLAQDNCDNLDISYTDELDIECGTGTIERTWTVTDVGGGSVSCTQTISLKDGMPYDGSGIIWPSDTTITQCNAATDPSITGEPFVPVGGSCSDIIIGYTDDPITMVPGACLKLFRIWEVIDWCQYDPNSGSQNGRWSYSQTIQVLDTEAPIFNSCDDLTFCNFKPDCGLLGLDLSVDVTDACTGDQVNLTWNVDEFDNGTIDASGTGQHIGGQYGVGAHKITYYAEDGCGNATSCSFYFTIEDCRKPTVVCDELIAEIMQTGEITIFPEQLDAGSSTDNCTAANDLTFSFSADINNDEIILTCDNLGNNEVEVWITDEAGNQDFCVTNIILQDNMGACSTGPLVVNVGGQISNWENESVEDVMIELSSDDMFTEMTDYNGSYGFSNLPMGYDYTITPSLNEDHRNGVTTFDLVLITRHILGTQKLDSPYKLIAADVNNTGTISVSDVLEMRKLVLFVEEEFANNTSWRFVESDYIFANPNNPFVPSFPELSNLNDLDHDMMTGDFMAVKIGDLNGSAQTSSLIDLDDRNNLDLFSIQAEDQSFESGEIIEVDITADKIREVLGYQFTMIFDNEVLEFLDIKSSTYSASENIGLTMIDKGIITTSWNNSANIPLEKNVNATLFKLKFKAKANGTLSEILDINSSFTQAEAYSLNEELMNVELHFNNEQGAVVASEHFVLYQNIPNPVRNETVIGFKLPTATTATLKIFDASGKVLKVFKREGVKGYNSISIKQSELNKTGVLFYQLETSTDTQTRKMTVIK
jgi:hypothetical protein